jgi:hypothetical protein
MTGYKRMLWTLLVVALWALLGALANYQWNVFSLDAEAYKTIITAVIAGVGMWATNYLAPFIKQYGVGSSE